MVDIWRGRQFGADRAFGSGKAPGRWTCGGGASSGTDRARDGYVNSQGLNHWHTVSWDPGVADSRVLLVCYDCFCLMALFRTMMSLARDWVEVFVWTGHDVGSSRSTGWDLRYLQRIYPPCVVNWLGGYLTEIKVP